MCEVFIKKTGGHMVEATSLPDRTPTTLRKYAEATFGEPEEAMVKKFDAKTFRPQNGGTYGKMGCRTSPKYPQKIAGIRIG